MSFEDYIVVDPDVLLGKPIVKGTRLSVEFLVGLLAEGWSESDVLRSYPGLTVEELRACLAYAAHVLAAERVYPLHP